MIKGSRHLGNEYGDAVSGADEGSTNKGFAAASCGGEGILRGIPEQCVCVCVNVSCIAKGVQNGRSSRNAIQALWRCRKRVAKVSAERSAKGGRAAFKLGGQEMAHN